jgi:2-aminoadipate transaminase
LPELHFEPPEGGFTLFVESDEDIDEMRLLELATRAGTSFDPGSMFRPGGEQAPLSMRLSPCNVSEQEIDVAVRRLASALTQSRRASREASVG